MSNEVIKCGKFIIKMACIQSIWNSIMLAVQLIISTYIMSITYKDMCYRLQVIAPEQNINNET